MPFRANYLEVRADGPARAEGRVLDAPLVSAALAHVETCDVKRAAIGRKPSLQEIARHPGLEDLIPRHIERLFDADEWLIELRSSPTLHGFSLYAPGLPSGDPGDHASA